MSDDTEARDRHEQHPNAPEIKELGVAKRLTCGSSLITPWLENSIPPFNHWLPVE